MTNGKRIGQLDDLLIIALREGDALKVAELRAELDNLLEQERAEDMKQVMRDMAGKRIPAEVVNVGLN